MLEVCDGEDSCMRDLFGGLVTGSFSTIGIVQNKRDGRLNANRQHRPISAYVN